MLSVVVVIQNIDKYCLVVIDMAYKMLENFLALRRSSDVVEWDSHNFHSPLSLTLGLLRIFSMLTSFTSLRACVD